MSKPPLGFVPEPLVLPLSSVLPSRKTPEGLLASRKFKQITASIEAVGLIEPLSVGKPNRRADAGDEGQQQSSRRRRIRRRRLSSLHAVGLQ